MRGFRITSLAMLAVAAVAWMSSPAQAGTIAWNYSGDFNNNAATPDSGGGLLTYSAIGGGEFLVTGISGTFDGAAITSLLTVGSCCAPPNNDNLLFLSGGPLLDEGGIAFSTSAGADFNLYYGGINGLMQMASTPYADIATPGAGYGVFAVPEPSTVALFGIGLTSLLFLRRRAA
jgi:hypothetical protein